MKPTTKVRCMLFTSGNDKEYVIFTGDFVTDADDYRLPGWELYTETMCEVPTCIPIDYVLMKQI
jgi:hypothetical protein